MYLCEGYGNLGGYFHSNSMSFNWKHLNILTGFFIQQFSTSVNSLLNCVIQGFLNGFFGSTKPWLSKINHVNISHPSYPSIKHCSGYPLKCQNRWISWAELGFTQHLVESVTGENFRAAIRLFPRLIPRRTLNKSRGMIHTPLPAYNFMKSRFKTLGS